MTARRTTTADIMQELQAIKQELKDMQSNQAAFHTRLFALETDKVKKDAIAEYLLDNPTPILAPKSTNRELYKNIGIALTIVLTIVASWGAK